MPGHGKCWDTMRVRVASGWFGCKKLKIVGLRFKTREEGSYGIIFFGRLDILQLHLLTKILPPFHAENIMALELFIDDECFGERNNVISILCAVKFLRKKFIDAIVVLNVIG